MKQFHGATTVVIALLCGAASAQTYVDETSNYGNFTRLAGVDATSIPGQFNFVDEFVLATSPYLVEWTTTLTVYGQEGSASSGGRGAPTSTFITTFPTPPTLMFATQPIDPVTGFPIYGAPFHDAGPAVDVNGVPVFFTYTPYKVGARSYGRWTMSANLPASAYNLHFSGTSCGGAGCRILGDSYVYVTSKVVEVSNAPPPPPPGGGDD
jgi:hypothetical protein